MDALNEKKWFVYLGDHHEGPFSLEEIKGKLDQGQVSTSSFAWAEGMNDWKVLSEISAFKIILDTKPKSESFLDLPLHEPSTQETAKIPSDPGEKLMSVSDLSLAGGGPPVADIKPSKPTASPLPAHEDPPQPEAGKKEHRSRRPLRFVTLGFLVLIGAGAAALNLEPTASMPAVKAAGAALADATQPILDLTINQFPALTKWISPIPRLETVAPADYEDLKKTAAARLDREGPRLSVALSATDPLAPVFYVSSNLPDGTTILIFAEGIPDTLLNQTTFSGAVKATLTKRLGKSEILRFTDGKPIPRGQYDIFAIEGEPQPGDTKNILANLQPVTAKVPATLPKGFKVFATKSYFLGGNRDNFYTARLKEFHDKLREKSLAELAELKQFSGLFDNQLKATTEKFSGLSKGKTTPAKKKTWSEFHKSWNEFGTQMSTSFAKWTPEDVQKDFFYGMLYQQILMTYKTIEDLHQLQNSFFSGTVDHAAFDIQVGQASAVAVTATAALNSKIEQAEKIPPSPNGMPRKDGL